MRGLPMKRRQQLLGPAGRVVFFTAAQRPVGAHGMEATGLEMVSVGDQCPRTPRQPIFQDPVRSTTGAEAALFFTDSRFSRASSLPP